MKTLADINRQSSPRFSLEECLEQIFGIEWLGDNEDTSYILQSGDGFYDTSIVHYVKFMIGRIYQEHEDDFDHPDWENYIAEFHNHSCEKSNSGILKQVRIFLNRVYTQIHGKNMAAHASAVDKIIFFRTLFCLEERPETKISDPETEIHITIRDTQDKMPRIFDIDEE